MIVYFYLLRDRKGRDKFLNVTQQPKTEQERSFRARSHHAARPLYRYIHTLLDKASYSAKPAHQGANRSVRSEAIRSRRARSRTDSVCVVVLCPRVPYLPSSRRVVPSISGSYRIRSRSIVVGCTRADRLRHHVSAHTELHRSRIPLA